MRIARSDLRRRPAAGADGDRGATRLGWRIVAFTFPGATEPAGWAEVVIPSRIEAMNPVLEALAREKIAGMLFSGKFWMGDLLGAAAADAAHTKMAARAGALLDDNITRVIVETLTAFGVELLDQRPFFGDWLEPAGCCSRRAPTDAEWADVRARAGASPGSGRCPDRTDGRRAARRGERGGGDRGHHRGHRARHRAGGRGRGDREGRGADHDYRFDTPGIGPDTIDAAIAGRRGVLAIEAGRVAILDRAAVRWRAPTPPACRSWAWTPRSDADAIMIVAGEASGDLHGATLCRALRDAGARAAPGRHGRRAHGRGRRRVRGRRDRGCHGIGEDRGARPAAPRSSARGAG